MRTTHGEFSLASDKGGLEDAGILNAGKNLIEMLERNVLPGWMVLKV